MQAKQRSLRFPEKGWLLLDNTPYKVYIENMTMSGKQLVKLMQKNGWVLDRVNGSHHIMRKNGNSLSVPVHGSENLKPGILNSLMKEAGLK